MNEYKAYKFIIDGESAKPPICRIFGFVVFSLND